MLKIDNKSAILLCKNWVYHDQSKHTHYHFILNYIDDGKDHGQICQFRRTSFKHPDKATWSYKIPGAIQEERNYQSFKNKVKISHTVVHVRV